ncbi:MAG: T9SS type A sorting domain-containing protein [Flavobacteriales bacterium]|nr:T9SS type A sorting domain-containing protein [Flavobacteriales bacterium]
MSAILRSTLLAFGLISASCAFATSAGISVLRPETCGNANGELFAQLQGNPIYEPLTYAWSNGATTQIVTGLAAGSYSVTITDAQGTPFTANATLPGYPALPFDGSTQFGPSVTSFYDLTGFTGAPCPGECNGILSLPMVSLGGTPPFSASFDVAVTPLGTDNYGFPYFSGFCDGALVNYTITDALGCQGSSSFTVGSVDMDAVPYESDVQGACIGSDIGSFILNGNWTPTRYTLYNGGVYLAQDEILPEGMSVTYTNLEPGTYSMVAYPMLGQCEVSTTIEVPDLGPGCTQVQGQSWFDQDADCVFDAGEVGVPGSVMVVQPGTQYAITGGNGHYSFNVPAGNYTIAQTDPTLVPYCPASQPVPFTVNGPVVNIDFANNSTAPLDMRAHIGSGGARPGFAHSIHASVANSTAQLTGAVEVIITVDPTVTIDNVTPTPTTSAGNVHTWQLAELDYFGAQGFSIQTTVPVSTPLGTVLNHSISVSTLSPDADLSDNTDLTTQVVVGSYDPNDKTGVTSSRTSDALYFINEDEWIDYTIRFQNTGTAEAFFVTITDTLPEELDMTSFQMAVASHAHTYTFKPGRVVEWFFDDINLPDSTTNEAESHGFVKFRIRPTLPLVAGTVIENIANIYFDYNPPVITEPSVLVAEFSTGALEPRMGSGLSVFPNPASDEVIIELSSNSGANVLRVLNMDGRVVDTRRISATRTVLDVSDLAIGVYVIEVHGPDGGSGQVRFVRR